MVGVPLGATAIHAAVTGETCTFGALPLNVRDLSYPEPAEHRGLARLLRRRRECVPTLPQALSSLVKVRKRLDAAEMEPVVEDHSSRQRQVVRLNKAQVGRVVASRDPPVAWRGRVVGPPE